MKYIFTLYAIVMVDFCTILLSIFFCQSLHNLTCTKNYAEHKIGREVSMKQNATYSICPIYKSYREKVWTLGGASRQQWHKVRADFGCQCSHYAGILASVDKEDKPVADTGLGWIESTELFAFSFTMVDAVSIRAPTRTPLRKSERCIADQRLLPRWACGMQLGEFHRRATCQVRGVLVLFSPS
jgi:hypothetical protein